MTVFQSRLFIFYLNKIGCVTYIKEEGIEKKNLSEDADHILRL